MYDFYNMPQEMEFTIEHRSLNQLGYTPEDRSLNQLNYGSQNEMGKGKNVCNLKDCIEITTTPRK